jgi:hypothetical protein
MSRPRNIEDVQAMAADHEGAAAWESRDESPIFDDSELLTSLAAKRPATSRPVRAALAEAPTPEPAPPGLAAQLHDTPAPAVGAIGLDLTSSMNTLAPEMQAFSGNLASSTGRAEIHGIVVNVDLKPNGEWEVTGLPRPERFTAPSYAEAARRLREIVVGVRQTTDVGILVVLPEALLSVVDAAPLAREASCVVAALQHRPAVHQPVWEPRLLDPLPAPQAAPEPPAKPVVTKAPIGKPTADARWLARVPEMVRDLPEMIAGPRGEHIRTAYWGRDARRGEYVLMTGWSEHQGRNWPLELELVPGVWVALEDTRVYRGAI